MKLKVIKREKRTREDGSLVELFSKKYDDFECKHSYLVIIEPGKTRAKHFHKQKTEAIAAAYGETEIIAEDPDSKQRICESISTDGTEYKIIVIPPGMAHAVRNRTKTPSSIIVFSDSEDITDTVGYTFEGLK